MVTAATSCCGAFSQSLYKMHRNSYATGDIGSRITWLSDGIAYLHAYVAVILIPDRNATIKQIQQTAKETSGVTYGQFFADSLSISDFNRLSGRFDATQ